ncbi:MAG: flagellar hook-length control protein FliK [Aestuariivirga sp.]|nr:flagellar hook-length control protein FliK [Aestuariivirga sp.]
MNRLIPSLEIDIKPAAGVAAHRTRAGNNGRHHGKMPDVFPDVLADVVLSKNVAVEAPNVLAPPVKSTIREDEVDADDKEQELPPEEKILQPAIPVDMKQYLQVIAAVVQKQVGGGEPVPFPVIAAAALSTVASRSESPSANTKPTEVDVTENAPNDAIDLDVPKRPEMKAPDPRKMAERNDISPPTQSIGPPRVENLPGPKEIFQPKVLKEILQPKAADAELRVIKVETSFSPAASSPFIVQIAKIIADGLAGPVHNPVAVIGNPMADPRPDVVKSIQIQLHPDDLGKIKVAMHLRGDELKLKIEVTNKAVETLLLNDHQALKDLMGQAGYDIKDASISIAVSPADLNPPQRSVAASNPSQESLVGQGGRQHPGTSEENQNPFQKARGQHASASDFENGQEAKLLAPGSRRGNGVFV